jgi:hypothetical protein
MAERGSGKDVPSKPASRPALELETRLATAFETPAECLFSRGLVATQPIC